MCLSSLGEWVTWAPFPLFLLELILQHVVANDLILSHNAPVKNYKQKSSHYIAEETET